MITGPKGKISVGSSKLFNKLKTIQKTMRHEYVYENGNIIGMVTHPETEATKEDKPEQLPPVKTGERAINLDD